MVSMPVAVVYLFVLALVGLALVGYAILRFRRELHVRVSLPLIRFEFHGRN